MDASILSAFVDELRKVAMARVAISDKPSAPADFASPQLHQRFGHLTHPQWRLTERASVVPQASKQILSGAQIRRALVTGAGGPSFDLGRHHYFMPINIGGVYRGSFLLKKKREGGHMLTTFYGPGMALPEGFKPLHMSNLSKQQRVTLKQDMKPVLERVTKGTPESRMPGIKRWGEQAMVRTQRKNRPPLPSPQWPELGGFVQKIVRKPVRKLVRK